MNATTVVSTDLLTPLGAYLRLRESGLASFLLESVEHGRLGRHSFVGAGSELVGFAEAAALARPVVGYLGYDHAAVLEPTVPLPANGRELPESRFVVADTLVRFDHGLGMAEVLCGDPSIVTELLNGPQPHASAGRRGRAGSTRRLPSRHDYERSDRPPRPRSSSTARCGASTPRPTSSCSSSTGSRWSAPRPRRSSSSRAAARA